MATKQIAVFIRFPTEIIEQIDALAVEEGLRRTDMIRTLVRFGIRAKKSFAEKIVKQSLRGDFD